MYVTCRTLNVRSGAGTSYSKVGTLSRNAAVEVESVSGGWAKLTNGTYVCYKYLTL
ncbi:MAG: SH3 domain-containing protein [Candidatus Spyradocola sp.]